MIERIKKIDYRHYICILITLAFLALLVFVYRSSVLRLAEACRDLGYSIGSYFNVVFGLKKDIPITVIQPSAIDYPIVSAFDEFKLIFVAFWQKFADMQHFLSYGKSIASIALFLLSIALVVLILGVAVFQLFKSRLFYPNNDYNMDTKPLRVYKKIYNGGIYPVNKFIAALFYFIQKNAVYWKLWLLIWLINLNAASILVAAAAYLFYISVSFNFLSVPFQLFKLLLDLSLLFGGLPWPVWIIIFLILFDIWRKKIAYDRLERFEAYNQSFIEELPIVSLSCGAMNKKKTTLITDMSLSQSVMFRNKALNILFDCDLKFPDFPWINFELTLRQYMDSGEIYNLAGCERYIKNCCRSFELLTSNKIAYKAMLRHNRKHSDRPITICFDYDYSHYPTDFDDRLKVDGLYDVLETYAKAYFIYIGSCFNVSNYAIRLDEIPQCEGNFILWDSDFFRRNAREIDFISRHSKILDFDVLRLGKKVVENNIRAGSFEFGVVSVTEIGKERQNNLELQGVKKKDENTNQKNDGFNSSLKMSRHPGTVAFVPFIKIFADEQRPESLGADARELCKIINIDDCGDIKIALPFFGIETVFCEWVLRKFNKFYYEYRYLRGDNCLLMRFIKAAASKLAHYKMRRYNLFGYTRLSLGLESGTLEGKIESRNYYLCSKKIYSKRFSTDCFSEYFHEKALQCSVGLRDYDEYANERASFEELKKQNSYFVLDLLNKAAAEELTESASASSARNRGKQ